MEEKKLIGSGQCPFCGKDNRVEATDKELKGYEKWERGEASIQNAMPSLSAEKREVLISGICLSCQKDVSKSSEHEDDQNEPTVKNKEYEFTPEPIEYELNKIGYALGEEENGVVEFVNEETNMALLLDYNLMSATKVDKTKEESHDNGHTEDIYLYESTILKKYGFDIDLDDSEFIEDDIFDYLDDEYLDGIDDDDDFDDDSFDIDDDLPF